ncbi:type IV secretion system protein [Xanthomonas campestris pv. zinniae]|uniref:type IV secretion system protein n=1 Tax=Xanthomonas cannabis TaxID=1885674 RepID=UPI001E2FC7B9|nr:type IV secretion system protein [Xanthomonas campestris pv. zinniae]
MLLLYQVAVAMFVGFGPLFILCLLFDQTKQLFQKWLLYGIGTMFSMGVLAAMVSICRKMVAKVEGCWIALGGQGAWHGAGHGFYERHHKPGHANRRDGRSVDASDPDEAFNGRVLFPKHVRQLYGLLADRRCSIGWWIIQTARVAPRSYRPADISAQSRPA